MLFQEICSLSQDTYLSRFIMPSRYTFPSRMVISTPKGKQGGVVQVRTEAISFISISQLTDAVPISPEARKATRCTACRKSAVSPQPEAFSSSHSPPSGRTFPLLAGGQRSVLPSSIPPHTVLDAFIVLHISIPRKRLFHSLDAIGGSNRMRSIFC